MKKILFIFLLFISQISLGQTADERFDEVINLEKTIVSLDLLTPGLTIEAAIGTQNSLMVSASTGFAFYASSTSNGQSESTFVFVPIFMAQYRGYYNLQKRAKQGKRVSFNSGNYLGFHVAYQGRAINDFDENIFEVQNGIILGPVWGLQRNGTVTFDLNLGPGLFATNNNSTEFTIIGNLKVGLNLTKLFRQT
jgi:hypothetical protein